MHSKRIGDKAEQLVKTHLETTLSLAERRTLVHHAALGETPGYDFSVIRNGEHQAIEVKGTTLKQMVGFEMTANEWEAAAQINDRYSLYLVAGVDGDSPLLQVINNPLALELSGKISRHPLAWHIKMNGGT